MWTTSLDLIRASIFVTREIYGDVAFVSNNVKKLPLNLLLNYKANSRFYGCIGYCLPTIIFAIKT
jgi:hypothetical protein